MQVPRVVAALALIQPTWVTPHHLRSVPLIHVHCDHLDTKLGQRTRHKIVPHFLKRYSHTKLITCLPVCIPSKGLCNYYSWNRCVVARILDQKSVGCLLRLTKRVMQFRFFYSRSIRYSSCSMCLMCLHRCSHVTRRRIYVANR